MRRDLTTVERSVLGILTLNPQLIDAVDLESEDFSEQYHRDIFQTLFSMKGNDVSIGLPTLYTELQKKGIPVAELSEYLEPEFMSPIYLEDFTATIIEASTERKLRTLQDTISNPALFLEKAKELEARLQRSSPKTVMELYTEYVKDYEKRKLEEKGPGVLTGFENLDSLVYMRPGTLNVLAARPSVGKSSLAMSIAVNAAYYQQNVLFISIEMDEKMLMERLLSMDTGVNIYNFIQTKADKALADGKKACEYLGNSLQFIYKPNFSSKDVARLVIKENAKRKIDLVIVDYLQILKDKQTQNENVTIGNMTRSLKALAGECELALIALSQFNRESEKQDKPKIHQLRGSGSIEQDADSVLILHRRSKKDEYASLDIAKNRGGAADETLFLKFNPSTTKYEASTITEDAYHTLTF